MFTATTICLLLTTALVSWHKQAFVANIMPALSTRKMGYDSGEQAKASLFKDF